MLFKEHSLAISNLRSSVCPEDKRRILRVDFTLHKPVVDIFPSRFVDVEVSRKLVKRDVERFRSRQSCYLIRQRLRRIGLRNAR